jgi:hypothetical protein
MCLLKGKFPTLWKQAVAMHIFKQCNNALVINCRPVTVLNKFSKILEIIVLDSFPFSLNLNYLNIV